MEIDGLENQRFLKACAPRMCAGCGARATYRVAIEDLTNGRLIREIYLCGKCLMLKFVCMRPYMARTKPRVFDELVCRGMI